MKKLLVIMLCLLAVFAIVSCKEEPGAKTPEAKPEENGGTLTVKPAVEDPDNPESTINWGDQTKKFQFAFAQEVEAGQSIEFLAKVSDDVTRIDVRDGSNDPDYTVWSEVSVNTLEENSDGWYIVTIDGDLVTTDCDYIGITLRLPEQNPDIFISIKNLKIDDEIVYFSELNAAEYVKTLVNIPNKIEATITE